MSKTVVHVLRHGEVHNPDRILYGRLPGFRLSELGVQMAKAAAQVLAERDVVHVVASPLERAQQTAEPIAAQFGLPVGVDERLIESANWFEGKRVSPGDGSFRDPRNWWVLRDPVTPSWGEAYRAIAERMFAALHAARVAAEGREAVLVSHQLPIWTLRRYVERKRLWHDPRKRQCGLASLTSFHFDGAKVVGIGYSEPAAHLVAMSPTARTAKGGLMRARRWTAGLLATVAAVALAGCTSKSQEKTCATTPEGVIECAPDQRSAPPKIAGELLTGGNYDVSQARGQVVVLNFWGSWCAPCRAEADDLEATYQATKGSGVTFLGINVQDSKDKALAFEEGRVTYPSIFDPPSRLALALDIPPNTIPATVVLDREGRIAVVIRAAVRQEGLQPIVERIAAEQSGAR